MIIIIIIFIIHYLTEENLWNKWGGSVANRSRGTTIAPYNGRHLKVLDMILVDTSQCV